MDLNEILKVALKGGASDIHIKAGLPPMFRLDGALVPLKNSERLTQEDVQVMSSQIMNPVQKQRFEETREVDLAYGIAGLGRFRVNCFQQRGSLGIVFRVIPLGVKTLENKLVVDGFVKKGQILPHRCLEELDLLSDHAHPLTQLRERQLAYIHSAHADRTPAGVIEAEQQPRQRGFAAARSTQQPHHFAGPQPKRYMFQYLIFRAVGKEHVLELDRQRTPWNGHAGRIPYSGPRAE